MNIFIGNLSYNVTEGDLRKAFETFWQVVWYKANCWASESMRSNLSHNRALFAFNGCGSPSSTRWAEKL